jgi:hypothetical protein
LKSEVRSAKCEVLTWRSQNQNAVQRPIQRRHEENHGIHGKHGKEAVFFRVFRVFRGYLLRRNGSQNGCGFERRKLAAVALLAWASAFAQPAAPSLLPNGTFEQADAADGTKPAGWGKPDGLGVQWPDSGDAAHGRAIRMDTRVTEKAMAAQWHKAGLTNEWNIPKPADNAIAETYGLSLYSDPVPVQRDQPYRITFDFKGHSGGAKVWVRGWGMMQGKERRRWETWVGCNSKEAGWTTCSQVFFPGKFRPEVTKMRVMLYAFYPAGVYWFDNIRIEPITVQEYEAAKK